MGGDYELCPTETSTTWNYQPNHRKLNSKRGRNISRVVEVSSWWEERIRWWWDTNLL